MKYSELDSLRESRDFMKKLIKTIEELIDQLNVYQEECARLERRIREIGSIPNDSPGWRELRKRDAEQTVIDLKERLAAWDAKKK